MTLQYREEEESKVSIIIPCFNGELFIDRAIKSVYEQNWPRIELIVVNDGSTDNSEEHILKWKRLFVNQGFNFVYVYQENKGLAQAINAGLKEVSGKYLLLLDADDMLLDGAISEKAVFLNENPDYSLVRSNGLIVRDSNSWLFIYDEKEKKEDVFDLLMSGKTCNWAGSYMVRTSKLFSVYPDREIYPSRFGQNLQILIPCSFHEKCGFIDKPQMKYIQMSDSLSRENDKEKRKQKSLINLEGYYDIRVHIIERLKIPNDEKKHWYNEAKRVLNKEKMQIGNEYNDTRIVTEAINALKQDGLYSIEEKALYYSFSASHNAILLNIYKALRKIKGLIATMKNCT